MSNLFHTPVREYMSGALISVAPDAKLSEVQFIFEQRDISAVPVIDAQGKLCGIVSTTDLLRVARVEVDCRFAAKRVTAPLLEAREIMKSPVITVDEEAPVRDAAAAMNAHRIHRLVVLRKGRPVGIISTRDAIRAVLFHRVEVPLDQVMTTPVATIDLGVPLHSAVGRLSEAGVHGLVVVDGEWPVGVFTHTEAIAARDLPPDLLRMPVERAMSYETICLDVGTPLYRVAGHAIQMRVRRVLAVHARALRGIVTGFDIVRIMTSDDL